MSVVILPRFNGFQENRDEDTIQGMLGDVVDQLSMGLPTQKDMKLFLGKNINHQHHSEQHHEQQLKAAYQM